MTAPAHIDDDADTGEELLGDLETLERELSGTLDRRERRMLAELARERTAARAQRRAETVDAPILILPIAANRKLAPVELREVGSSRLRPIPLGPYVSATYAPVRQTCPDSCTFKGAGCMVDFGPAARPVRRLEALAEGLSALELARHEARGLDGLCREGVRTDGGRDGQSPRDLRLHISGDSTTLSGTWAIASAVERWKKRGGGSPWTFTHAWRHVPRSAWGPVSTLASIEKPEDASRARAQGYAPAIVVREFPSERAFSAGGTTWIPCPQELGRGTCVECRLCLDRSDWLRSSGRGIAFAAHGAAASTAKRQLPVIASGGAS